MTGWCPVHDRTYEADDGLCPRCGTALVTDEAPSDEATVIVQTNDSEAEIGSSSADRPPSRRPSTTVIGVAAAVVIAFVAGLAFPDANTASDRTGSLTRDAAVDLNIGVTRNSANLPLRLESFTQRGRNVVARISVGDEGGVELGKLRTASVWFILAGGGEISDEIPVRSTITGFIIEGMLIPSASTPVVGVRIDSLTFAEGVGADLPLDISGVWPATLANQPRTDRLAAAIRPGDGRVFRVYGLVGWADRIEVGLEIIGSRPGWLYGTRYELVSDSSHEGALQEGFESTIVRFDTLPKGKRRWAFRIAVDNAVAIGPWEWSFV
jgi:hypothetical protein